MTTEDFNQLKAWIEKSAVVEFAEEEAILDTQGDASFTKNIDADRYLELSWCNDKCYLTLNFHSGELGLEIYNIDERNAHLCVDIFSHMIHWNI